MNTLVPVLQLDTAVRAVCPIFGISVPTVGNSATVAIQFDPSATAQQISSAQSVVAGWDWSAAAQAARVTAANPDLATLRDQAQNALDGNTTYLAIASPTNAQVVAQVQALTQQNQKIIKALKLLAIAALN